MSPAALALPERQWWPLSSKNSSSSKPGKNLSLSLPSEKLPAQNNSRKSSSGMKFSTLTNAMGFKSKKQQPLTIQEPPLMHNASGLDKQTIRLANRPPAKSVSSTVQSWDDPVEPQTPSDGPRGGSRYQRSMLATPESDPFFSEGIRFQPAIHDPNRLSVYSGSSQSDMGLRKNDLMDFNRSSYTSSSAHSHHHGPDMSPNSSAASLSASIDVKFTSPTRSTNTRRKKPHLLSSTDVVPSVENVLDLDDLDDDLLSLYPSLSKSGSSSTLTERNKLSGFDLSQASRAPLRRRGMTDGGSTWSPQSIPDFLRSTPPSPKVPSLPTPAVPFNSPTRPCVPVRQTSASHVSPPSAPPRRNLPPPPSTSLPYRPGLEDISPGSSSSGLSFTSAVSSNRDLTSSQTVTRNMVQELDKEHINSAPSAGRTVKKAMSHQSFSKGASNFASSSSPFAPGDDTGERAPRKQRSFHHTSRSILPSLSMPIRNPPLVPSQLPPALPSSTSEAQLVVEQRRGGATTTSGRKRLFSGGSAKRPSSQIFSPGDDDQRSVFTSEGEHAQEAGVPFMSASGRSDSPALSVGNEASSDPPGSPLTSTDYTPQRIMSPAEMLRVEASWNDGSEDHDFGVSRQRVHSFTSISTSMSHGADGLTSPVPKHYIVDRAINLTCGGSHRQRGDSGISSPLRQTLSSHASQTSMSRNGSPSPTHSPFSPPAGLPLPPRPRRQTANSAREAQAVPLSPRSIRRQNSKASTRSQPVRSIMRKPSFLDIEDEKRQRQSIPVPSRLAGSFLDLERGKDSFDTIRSEDERED